MAQKLGEDLAEFRKEAHAFQTKVLELLEAQAKAAAATHVELAKIVEAQTKAAAAAAAKQNRTPGTKKKEELIIPDKQPDIKSWFITYYLNNMDEINNLVPEEAMVKVMSVVSKKPQAKTPGTPLNKVKASTIYELVFPLNNEFTKAVTLKFEEAHPKADEQAP